MSISAVTWFKNFNSIVTPDYIIDRLNFNFIQSVISQSVYEINHPMSPWITIEMINILENILKSSDSGFEFGSGSSTIWFGKKTAHLMSDEHNKLWFDKVGKMIIDNKLSKKIDLIYVNKVNEIKNSGALSYTEPIKNIKNNSLDYCFVDGLFRDDCILLALPKLKHGGILIVDNVDNYFPKNSISKSIRYKRDNFSKVVSKNKMNKIYKILDKWRCVWTTSAIQDTALWIKP